MKILKQILTSALFRSSFAVCLIISSLYGTGVAEFSAATYNVDENVSGGYIDITINGNSAIGLLGIKYSSSSQMTAIHNGGTFTDDADNLYNAAALGDDGHSDTDNNSTDIQVYFQNESSLTISIKIDDDNRWEGGPSGTDEYLQIELYEPGGALTVAPGDANGNSTTISTAKIYIEDNEASEPVLTFYQETTTANEHDDLWIYIVVDGDIGVGNVAGVSPTFTWEIVDGSSNAAIVDEAEHSGSYIDHSSSTTGDITFDENSYHNVGGNGNRQATRLYYRSYNDSRSEPEEQLEIRFKAASNTHCVITGGTYATHIHKITDYDWNQICAYGDCYPEPYFTNATRSVNESGTSGNISHTFTINLNGLTEIVPSTLNITVATTTGNNGTAETDISNATIAVPFNTVRMTSTTASFNVIDDNIYEGSTAETITLTVEDSPTGFTRNASRTVEQVVSVNDNESVPIASFHANYDPTAANENAGNPDFRLKLDKVSQIAANVTVTAGATGSGVQATGYPDKDSGSNGGRYDYWLGAGASDADGVITYTVPAFTTSGAAGSAMDITINDDSYFEDNESFRLTLSAGDANVSASATQDFTINQINSDDQLPTISFETAGAVDLTENGATDLVGTLPVKLIDSSGDALVSGKDVTFSWSVTNADTDGDGISAAVNQDYMLKDANGNDVTSGTISAFTDPPVYNIPITIVGDNTAEENKQITVTIALDGSVEGTDATVSGAVSVTKVINIVNDDADPEIQFSQATAGVTEGNSTSSTDILVQKVYSGTVDATEKTIAVQVTAAGSGSRSATDNSNADGDDYDITTTISSFNLGPSDANTVISVDADNDDYYEQSEEVTFTIASVTNGTSPTTNSSLVLTITDADSPPVVSLDVANNSTSAAEGSSASGGDYTLQVKQDIKSQYTTGVVDFGIALSGDFTADDYSASVSSVSLPPNSLAAVTIPITIANDDLYEDNETMTVSIAQNANASINGSQNSHAVTVTDTDDPPFLTFELASSTPNEGSGGNDNNYNVYIKLLDPGGSGNEQALGRSGSFAFTIAGSGTNPATETTDWVLTDPGTDKTVTLTTTAGVTATTVTARITLKDDNVFEYDEQLTLSLTASPTNLNINGNATHVMTIKEVESAPQVGFASADTKTGINETDANTYTPRIILEGAGGADAITSDYDVKIIWDIDETTYASTIVHAAASSGHPNTADYTMSNSAGAASARTVTISAGEAYVDLPTITFNGDSYYEDTEVLDIALLSAKYYDASGGEVGTNSWLSTSSVDHDQKKISITNSSGSKPVVEWASPTQSSTEPDVGNTTTVNLGVTIDAVAAKDLKVKYSLLSDGYTTSNEYADNNPADSDDFEFSQADGSKIITIPAYSLINTTIPTLTIKSEAVDTYEMKEDIRVTLVAWTNTDDAASGDVDGATVTADNNEILVYTINERTTAPVLEFEDADNALAYDESASARQITVKFKDSGTQKAAMPVIAYLTVDASTSTGLNGTDFGSDANPAAYADNFEVTIPASSTSQTFDLYAVADNRYEVAQTAVIDLNAYSASGLPSGKTLASNATDDGDETMIVTINASGEDEKPVAEWVDNSSGSVPYSASDGSREYDEGVGNGYFTLQLSRFSEKDITVNYSLDETEVTSDPPTLIATGNASAGDYPIDYVYWGISSDGTGTSSALSSGAGSVTFTGVGNAVSAATDRQYLNISVAIQNDNVNEWHETIILKIDGTGNDDITGLGAIDKLVIEDNDSPPTVNFLEPNSGDDVDENTLAETSPTFKIGLFDPTSGSATVSGKKLYFSVVTDAADATPGSDKDFIALTDESDNWITIDAATDLLAASGQATVTLEINGDLIDEEDQVVTVTLDVKGADYSGGMGFSSTTAGYDETAGDAATDGDPMTHEYTIKDDDDEPVLKFSSSASEVDEGVEETITIEFDDTAPNIILSEKTITVPISISTSDADCGSAGGCATPDRDYTTIATTAFPDIVSPETSTSIKVTPATDTRYEDPQDIVINMGTVTNASIKNASQSYTLTVIDVTGMPTAQFLNSSGAVATFDEVAEEAADDYTVTVKLTKVSEKTVTIPYTIDFTQNTAIIASDDPDALDNEYPSDWEKWAETDGSSELTFTVAGDGTQTGTGTLTISGAAADATALQEETFTIGINNDVYDEDTESIYITMDTPTNANGVDSGFRLDIIDDDDPVRFSFGTSNTGNEPDATGDEDATSTFHVYLLRPDDQTQARESGKTVTINWTMSLTGGDDDDSEINDFTYPIGSSFTGGEATGQLVFSPRTAIGGVEPTNLEITTSDIRIKNSDATYEPTESFSIAIASNDANAAASDHASTSVLHKYSITNKDAPPVIELSSATVNINENPNDIGETYKDFEFKIADTSPIQKSELDINAYFKIVNTTSTEDNDADIDNSDGVIDYDYNDTSGPMSDNQVVTISGSASSPITSLSTGTIRVGSYNDTFYEDEETFELRMYTYNDAQATTAGLGTGASNATAPDGSKTDDTGYDVSTVTIATDDSDLPTVQFYDTLADEGIDEISVPESDETVRVTFKLDQVSAKTVTVPYTLTLGNYSDEKTARIGSTSDDDYPYDYRAWTGLTVAGDLSGNSIATLTGTIDINAGQESNYFDITINNDDAYEFNETINLSIGTTAIPEPINADKASSNTSLEITVTNVGELKATADFSTTSTENDENAIINLVGPDPGDGLINLPIAMSKKSGKDIVLKYSIDHAFNYPADEDIKNIATKGIDYTFDSVTTLDGDSIVTIDAGETVAYIPLTIVDDSFDEYDQKLRVVVSVLTSVDDNDAAEMGDDSVYTFTIADNDPEPYIRFESDVTADETTIGNPAEAFDELITVSLVDNDGNSVQSEKIITVSYALDTEKSEGETDYTSATRDLNSDNNKYLDDFQFTDGDLSFSARTYSYSSETDSYTAADGESSKDITLSIYRDDLYEVDEYVNIELISGITNANTGELDAGDHSYVYTIQNDDGVPSVIWPIANPSTIPEGDPDNAAGGDYQSDAIEVGLSAESGTDILIEYSITTENCVEPPCDPLGTAREGNDNNFDYLLEGDDARFGTKTVTILAATAAATEWTTSIPIDVWDDKIVEAIDGVEENFWLQFDRYHDKGPDDTWATGDDNSTDVSTANIYEVTITDNDVPPDTFTVKGVVTITTNTDPVVDSHWNPVTAGYWNSYNTGLAVSVPIDKDNQDLDGGRVKLIARAAGGTPASDFTEEYAWVDLATDSKLITTDMFDSDVVFDVSAAEFEDASASPIWYVEGGEVDISAIITDKYGNQRIGNPSVTTITIDETAPSKNEYMITSVSASGGNEFDNYWNSTNTGLDVIVKAQNETVDATVNGGSVRVLAGIGPDPLVAEYYQLGGLDSIETSTNNVNSSMSIAISRNDVINHNVANYAQLQTINLKAEIVDIAGNKTDLDLATEENGGLIVIDEVHDSVDVTYSRKFVNESHSPTITATYDDDDPPFSTPKISVAYSGTNTDNDVNEAIMQEATANKIYTYSLDVPGSYGTSTFDGLATVTIVGTDMAGNPLGTTETNGRTVLRVDNTPPTIKFTYATNNDIDPNSNAGKAGDVVTVTAVASEKLENSTFVASDSIDASNVIAGPTLRVDPHSSSGINTNIEDGVIYDAKGDDDLTYTFNFDLPGDGEFADYIDSLVLTIAGTDWAGNQVDQVEGYLDGIDSTNIQFTLDNQEPVLNSFNIDSVSFINSTELGWTNSETLSSGWVKFVPVDAAQGGVATEGDEIPFAGDELSAEQVVPVADITNKALLEAALGDSNLYHVTFRGVDLVGNVSDTTLRSVTYDTLNPRLQTVVYDTEFMTALTDPQTGTTVHVTFSELQDEASPPQIRFRFGATESQRADGASWNGDVDLGFRDINLVKDNLNPKKWSGTLRSDDVPVSDTYDGFVWLTVMSSKDLAGNSFGVTQQNYVATDESTSPVFTNILYLDNKEPTATITYTNKRDTALTSYHSDPDSSYCCFAIDGDIVEVKVVMNEPIKYIFQDTPSLKLYYNKDGNSALGFGDAVGDTVLNIYNIDSDLNVFDENDSLGTVFYYEIEIPDGTKNHGTLTVELDAVDRSGTPMATYADSEQTLLVDSSSFVLEIDNIHPWGYPLKPIFDETVTLDSVTFPTDQFWTTGFRVVENWINYKTESVNVRLPHHDPSSDPTLYGQSETLPQGKIDLQVKNLDLSTVKWQTMGESDTTTGGLALFGDYSYLRTISRPIDDLIPEDMLNAGNSASNRLQFRAMITDRNGNITYGQPSDMYSINTETNLYEQDSINTDIVGYDIASPSGGDFNNGNFNGVIGSQIISSDSITISWTEFDDPGGDGASGIDMYEMQVYVYDEDPTGADSSALDSLFTVDMNQDGLDDPGHWYKIYKEQAPSFEVPILLNSLDSVVTDSASNIDIQYDYNDTLKHNKYYMIVVRAFDVAGNPSDTIWTNAIQRINSAPIFIDNLADLILYEDIAWDYDTVKVNDLDLSTLQNDSFTYTIEPRKIETNDSGGNDTNLVLINPPVVDPATGLVSWTPIQDSTLTPGGQDTIIDQSGDYVFTFFVDDAYGFKDTASFNATVNAVNDTPVVSILGPDKVISWQEDKPETEIVQINLSNYVKDIDNIDADLSWQFVIMDTSQLDEDFPLASVIVGPGTPKSVQTKLMKDYMGFDPARGIDLPRLARRAGATTMRMFSSASADSLITIDLDISGDSTYAIFNSTANYYGSDHRIIFIARDPFGALDMDTVIVNIVPENDPPVMTAIDTLVIDENDSIWIDFSQFTTDVDDSTLTFTIEGIYNTDSIVFAPEPYLSNGPGDTVLFNPFDLWSGHANFRVTASDEDAQSSQLFTLNVMRVPRPNIEVSLVQNNAFSSYVHIIIVDKEQKTKYLQLEVQNQRIDIDTVAAYTYTGDFSFGIGGGYSFDVLAIAEVGKTIYTNTFNLAPARVANRWYANSSDGNFSITGDPGSVDMDQSFLIVDSSLFINSFTDEASYVLGDESFVFNKPIEVQFGSTRDDLAIYQRDNGVIWKELPSINKNGQVLTFTDNTGYFRLGPKTIIVPEETDLHQNYPNPFNPSTTIKYDIGLLDGLEQKISVNVYNVMGQHVTTLVNNVSQVGQFYVRWDGADKFGKMLPSGIYFVQLKTDTGIIKNKKMMFLK